MTVFAYDDLPLFDEAVGWEDAQRTLSECDLGDGLPLVPPTRRRFDAMMAGVTAPDESYGHLAPMFGEIVPAAVAYNCVLAGCQPAELPIVMTALASCTAPDFNLLGIQTTTGTPTVAVLVHGPAIEALGMNAGTNCLGPGNRANACIGRAVHLCLVHIGGARPLIGDMATMGQPGKYTFCFAEGAHPLVQPLHVRRGLQPDESAVTILGVSGTAEVLPDDGRDSPELVLDPIRRAMVGARRVSGAGRNRPVGEQFFLLPPELADQIAKHGWDLAAIQRHLYGEDDPIAASAADIHPIITGGAGVKMTYAPLWMGGTQSVTAPVLAI